MVSAPSLAALLGLWLISIVLAQDCSKTCQSFGTDFVDSGTYFQNVQSTSNFTALQEFEDCQNDVSYNVLVDANGNQIECSNTEMTPDDTPQQVTCPLQKDQMQSGEYAMIVISNNGQCDPIDYVRSFSISVGTQQTSTVPITATVTSTSTPVESQTDTETTTITSTMDPWTSVVPNAADSTFTLYPLPSISYITRGILTMTSVSLVPSVIATRTISTTQACGDLRTMALEAATTPSTRRAVSDKLNEKWSVTLEDIKQKISKTSAVERRQAATTALSGPVAARAAIVMDRQLVARHEAAVLQVRQLLRKRAPDSATTTVTDSSSTVTQTNTVYASTTTVTGTTTIVDMETTTPTVTITSGGGSLTTVWAPVETITNVFWIPVQQVTATRVQSVTMTVTQTNTASC